MRHQGLKPYKVCINDDPVLTLTYFTAGSNWFTYVFELGKLLNHLTVKLAANDQIDRKVMF